MLLFIRKQSGLRISEHYTASRFYNPDRLTWYISFKTEIPFQTEEYCKNVNGAGNPATAILKPEEF